MLIGEHGYLIDKTGYKRCVLRDVWPPQSWDASKDEHSNTFVGCGAGCSEDFMANVGVATQLARMIFAQIFPGSMMANMFCRPSFGWIQIDLAFYTEFATEKCGLKKFSRWAATTKPGSVRHRLVDSSFKTKPQYLAVSKPQPKRVV